MEQLGSPFSSCPSAILELVQIYPHSCSHIKRYPSTKCIELLFYSMLVLSSLKSKGSQQGTSGSPTSQRESRVSHISGGAWHRMNCLKVVFRPKQASMPWAVASFRLSKRTLNPPAPKVPRHFFRARGIRKLAWASQ